MKEFRIKKNSFQFKTAQTIALGFAGVILFGAMLLSLPIAWAEGHHISFMDALFTSATSICVTGLVTVTTATAWSAFGKIIILLLIQLGGFGVVTCKTLVLLVMGKRIGIRSRKLIQESYNLDSLKGLIILVRKIVLGTLIVEGVGAVLYALVFVPEFGFAKGIPYAVFNAVSAFCNAGMDIIGENSLINYAGNPLVNFTTMGLIVMGGIGYLVWWDLIHTGKRIVNKTMGVRHALRSLELNTKIALSMTAMLIFGGTFFIFILEYDNPETIGNMSIGCKLMASMFQSVTRRTAGFLTVPQEGLREATAMVCILLMFVGGSPMGTAGGVKTTTIAILVMSGVSFFREKTIRKYSKEGFLLLISGQPAWCLCWK